MKGPIQEARFKRTQALRIGPKGYFRGTQGEWAERQLGSVMATVFGFKQ